MTRNHSEHSGNPDGDLPSVYVESRWLDQPAPARSDDEMKVADAKFEEAIKAVGHNRHHHLDKSISTAGCAKKLWLRQEDGSNDKFPDVGLCIYVVMTDKKADELLDSPKFLKEIAPAIARKAYEIYGGYVNVILHRDDGEPGQPPNSPFFIMARQELMSNVMNLVVRQRDQRNSASLEINKAIVRSESHKQERIVPELLSKRKSLPETHVLDTASFGGCLMVVAFVTIYFVASYPVVVVIATVLSLSGWAILFYAKCEFDDLAGTRKSRSNLYSS